MVKEEEFTAIGDTLKTLRERVRSRNHQCTILEAAADANTRNTRVKIGVRSWFGVLL